MSNANPTALRIGMTGLLDGRRYTVLGRVVLSVEVDGETYCWNEFYLGDATGLELTLVYDEVEEGSNWKVFKMFEPTRPLTAREAAAKHVGDQVDLGGKSGRISLVDVSRVCHIEGAAPEGTAVGDSANYFNADYGDRMIVVSWTGDEVEFYDGGPIAAWRVEEAFKLPRSAAERPVTAFSGLHRGGRWDASYLTAAVALGMLVLFGFVLYTENTDAPPAPPPPKVAAPARLLAVGARAALAGHRYTVTGYALVEV
ncbi:MAG: DUF4178 domain-containing protein, partial [Opitutae bacterium]|nr:DUF4178 domain-containing protein [Opitutae bacterium]